jgi:predicted type IV restriction endonuclease
MTLEEHIEDIRSGIKSGRFRNEASVSQGIVLRLLQVLGWPTFDTQVVCPEYSLEGRRVDFALCHPSLKPIAFIEVKQIGQSDGAERQLFEYAFHIGVPVAILTDGQEWNFFLPAEQGDYGERRVYKLDLVEREPQESAARLLRYLSYAEVATGRAIAAAREDYQNVSRNRQMLATLPEAWSKLVSEEDDLLLELVADRVESLSGFKPNLDTVAKFLRENVVFRTSALTNVQATQPPRVQPQRTVPQTQPLQQRNQAVASGSNTISVGFSLDGKFVSCRNGREVLIGVFEALSRRDPSFLERFAARPKHGRTRRYLARTADELYPGRPDLAREHFSKLTSGWYVGTNVSKAQIERITEMCCEVARIRLGKDVLVNIGE